MAERSIPTAHPLRRLFTGLTEDTFHSVLGMADPPLVDYVSELLTRFVHMDAIYPLRDAEGRRLSEIVDMLQEAEALPAEGRTRREVYRHIGDFTLFWAGLFPEALGRLQTGWCKDAFVDYCRQGKRSYYLASACEATDRIEETEILVRLSEQFELCAYGLNEMRRELTRIAPTESQLLNAWVIR